MLVAVEGAVATVTVARPGQANSLTTAAKVALLTALEQVANDHAVRAVILTGSGRAFCAGQDLAEHSEALASDPGHAFDTVGEHYSPIVQSLARCRSPSSRQSTGRAQEPGSVLPWPAISASPCRRARFAPAFTGIGLTADSGLSMTLPRAVGWSRAMGLLLLGTVIDAEEAERIGLVHEVVAPEELGGHVSALAMRLASGPTQAYVALKEALWYSASAALGDVLRLEGELQARLAGTSDHKAAVAAFLEKRRPDFTGT